MDNAIDKNKISYNFYDGYSGDSSSEYSDSEYDSSYDESSSESSETENYLHGVPIYHEMADPSSPHH